jgi:hypothetical protein
MIMIIIIIIITTTKRHRHHATFTGASPARSPPASRAPPSPGEGAS